MSCGGRCWGVIVLSTSWPQLLLSLRGVASKGEATKVVASGSAIAHHTGALGLFKRQNQLTPSLSLFKRLIFCSS